MFKTFTIIAFIFSSYLFAKTNIATLKKQPNGIYEGYAGKMFFQIDSKSFKGKSLDKKQIDELYINRKKSLCKDKYRSMYTKLGGVLNITVADNTAVMIYSRKCNTKDEYHKMETMDKYKSMYKKQLKKGIYMLGVIDDIQNPNKNEVISFAESQLAFADEKMFCNQEMKKHNIDVFFMLHGVLDKSYIKQISCK